MKPDEPIFMNFRFIKTCPLQAVSGEGGRTQDHGEGGRAQDHREGGRAQDHGERTGSLGGRAQEHWEGGHRIMGGEGIKGECWNC